MRNNIMAMMSENFIFIFNSMFMFINNMFICDKINKTSEKMSYVVDY